MNDPLGNRVKEVMVSQASRNDARGGWRARNEVLQAMKEAEDEKEALVKRKNQIELRLSQIKSTLSNRIPFAEVERLNQERLPLVEEKGNLDRSLADLGVRFHRLKRDLDAAENKETLADTNELLRKILSELEILNGRKRAT